jgi:hypothetical protein
VRHGGGEGLDEAVARADGVEGYFYYEGDGAAYEEVDEPLDEVVPGWTSAAYGCYELS